MQLISIFIKNYYFLTAANAFDFKTFGVFSWEVDEKISMSEYYAAF